MGKGIDYSLAKSKKELEEAIVLAGKEYLKNNYALNFDSLRKKFFPYISLSTTAVFLAKKDKKIIGTVSVIIDSDLGLPMDEVYKKEIDTLRLSGGKVAEISQLAINKEFFSRNGSSSLIVVMRLFKLVFHYCLYSKIDNICIAVNPKHSSFYDTLFFKNIGELKRYQSLNNAPAIVKTLDLHNFNFIKEQKKTLIGKIISDPPDYRIFKKYL